MKASWMWLLASGIAAADTNVAPTAADYAYAWPLELTGQASAYRVTLPLGVYAVATDAALRDVGVFDADGRPVTHQLDRPPRPRTSEMKQALPLVGLFGTTPDTAAEVVDLLITGDDITARVQRGPLGEGIGAEPPDRYIVDARSLDGEIARLELDWSDNLPSFVGTISVETSDNLADWRPVGRGSVADLSNSEHEVRRHTVDLTDANGEFLRLRGSGLPAEWQLVGVTAVMLQAQTEPALGWLALTPELDRAGSWVFEIGGVVRVEQIRLELAGENNVVDVQLEYWNAATQRWVGRKDITAFALPHAEGVVRNPAVNWPTRPTGRVRATVGSGQFNAPPTLHVGWLAHEVLFLNQGTLPYRLVAGRLADEREGYPLTRFRNANIRNLSGEHAEVAVGARATLRGDAALQIPLTDGWRQWLVWAALVAGVILVGVMSVRILRRLDDGTGE